MYYFIVERENIDVILFAIAKIDGEEKSKILDESMS